MRDSIGIRKVKCGGNMLTLHKTASNNQNRGSLSGGPLFVLCAAQFLMTKRSIAWDTFQMLAWF